MCFFYFFHWYVYHMEFGQICGCSLQQLRPGGRSDWCFVSYFIAVPDVHLSNVALVRQFSLKLAIGLVYGSHKVFDQTIDWLRPFFRHHFFCPL